MVPPLHWGIDCRWTGFHLRRLQMSSRIRRAADAPGDAVHGFYTHLTIYLIVNSSLLALNLLAGGPAWAVWPLVGWGIGLAAHGIRVFLGTPRGPSARMGSS
jgi:hypothetical protein